jgi:hypothetical protein
LLFTLAALQEQQLSTTAALLLPQLVIELRNSSGGSDGDTTITSALEEAAASVEALTLKVANCGAAELNTSLIQAKKLLAPHAARLESYRLLLGLQALAEAVAAGDVEAAKAKLRDPDDKQNVFLLLVTTGRPAGGLAGLWEENAAGEDPQGELAAGASWHGMTVI